jgi:hypothetical protein
MYRGINLIIRGKELNDAVELENKKKMLGKNRFTNMGTPMFGKNKKIQDLTSNTKTLLHRYEILNKAEKNNKENLTLLERGLMEGNDFLQLSKRKKKKPITNEIVEFDTKVISPYDDKFEKIIHYVDKYKIPYHSSAGKKSYRDLAHDVRDFEVKNVKKLIKLGLDKKYHEYGHYINIM